MIHIAYSNCDVIPINFFSRNNIHLLFRGLKHFPVDSLHDIAKVHHRKLDRLPFSDDCLLYMSAIPTRKWFADRSWNLPANGFKVLMILATGVHHWGLTYSCFLAYLSLKNVKWVEFHIWWYHIFVFECVNKYTKKYDNAYIIFLKLDI